MSQKKRVRVYKPGQIDNAMSKWFMQMGGVPQQPQQSQEQNMMNQVMTYAQQMLMEGEDPNIVYDDLVDQGVPSQLAAQVLEQLIQSMPPQQPSYSQPATAEAMYNQEVEEAEEEEAIPDFMDLAGLYDDEDDDDFEDFKKGGMTKNKFVKEYKKLALGGQKPDEIPGIQSAGFLGAVQNEANNYKIQKEAEEMYNNPFAVNALSQFVYGGPLPKAQDAGGAGNITQEAFNKYTADFEKYKKEQEERYKQLEQRYNQGYRNYPQQYNPYLYGNPYGQGYGNVPTMFNPYGRRGPIFQRTPYLQNFPGADFQGMQLSNFKIEPQKIDRKGLLKFLGPKTKYTWSGEWTRNPQTGAVTPAAGTTKTAVTNTNDEYEQLSQNNPYKDYVPASTIENTNYSQDTGIFSKDIERDIENPETVNPMQQGGYRFQPGGGVVMNEVEVTGPGQGLQRMPMLSPNYGDLMAATPGLANPTIDNIREPIKNALTVDIPALYDATMYGARTVTGALDDNRMKRDYLANFMGMAAGPEEFGQRGNYTVNQSANSSNFRPDLDGQIQYSQYGGQFELGEETEMTDEEIEKFLKGGGKLRFV